MSFTLLARESVNGLKPILFKRTLFLEREVRSYSYSNRGRRSWPRKHILDRQNCSEPPAPLPPIFSTPLSLLSLSLGSK